MLDAAVAVFARRGYHAASMDEIAEVAGISKPMVYAYLGAKEDLFTACIRRESERLLAAIVGSVESVPGGVDAAPEEVLWQGLSAFFRFVDERRDGWAVLHQRTPDGGGSNLGALRPRVIEVVTVLLGRAKASHGPHAAGADADLSAFAAALVGATESLAAWMLDQDGETPEATASRLMNLVWVGFADLLAGELWRPSRPS